MNEVVKQVLIVGSCPGLGRKIAELFPEAKPERALTGAELKALKAAQTRREKRATKLRALPGQGSV